MIRATLEVTDAEEGGSMKTLAVLTAVNVGKVPGKRDTAYHEWRAYRVKECDCALTHDRKMGTLALLIKMAGHATMCDKPKRT